MRTLNKGFYVRLACQNLWRNRLLNVPYFIASAVMSCVYFMCMTIIRSQTITNMSYGENMQMCFSVGIGIMSLLIAIFMLYINSFLIKRRKKEFGLYAVLGLEKRHVARVIIWENLFRSLASLALGILSGCALGRLVFLALFSALGELAPGSTFDLPLSAFAITGIVFAVIFVLTTLSNLWHVARADAIELLKGAKKGEKKVRFTVPITVLGLALLAWAYYTSITVTNPLSALMMFFVAVFAVIIATYLLFTGGSVFLLKRLKNNKHFYYKPKNFVAVAGMTHRMKQNAVGLASICILSTMVLVTVCTCVSLYTGQEDILRRSYPYDMVVQMNDDDDPARIEKLVQTTAAQNGVHVTESLHYTYAQRVRIDEQALEEATEKQDMNAMMNVMGNSYEIRIISSAEYARVTGETLSIADDQWLSIAQFDVDAGKLEGCAGHLKNTVFTRRETITPERMSVWIAVVNDPERLPAMFTNPDNNIRMQGSGTNHPYYFDFDADDKTLLNISHQVDEALKSEHAGAYISQSRAEGRMQGRSLYGGLLFLGAFFTVLFLCNTALIIYFKQLSEGYDDRERFVIMQQVGMDELQVKRTINRQVMIVFFLPLVAALVHLAAAGNMIIKLLQMFALFDVGLTLLCMAVTALLFGIVYWVVYRFTSIAYYKIVKAA